MEPNKTTMQKLKPIEKHFAKTVFVHFNRIRIK